MAHGRSHCKTTKYIKNAKYRSLLGKVTKNSEHYCNLILNSVTVIFSQYDLHNIFKRLIDGKKKLSTETLIIRLQSCEKFPVFVMFACFPFKWNHSTIHNCNLSKTEGRIQQILNIMAEPVGHLTIKFNCIKFNSLGWLIKKHCNEVIANLQVFNMFKIVNLMFSVQKCKT